MLFHAHAHASTLAAAVALAATAAAQVQFLGVAIAGGDFGCQIDGTCPTGSTQLPLGGSGGGGDGPGQMQHWASLSKPLNLFRLPVSWQFLVDNQLGGDLDAANAARYDQLVQACLATGAHCMVDIHNFARWDGAIIGQGGPTDDQFSALWAQLAARYAAQDRMVFELMNEPHDLDINTWAATCQKAVAAIRGAGATSQMILLPGTNFDSAATLVSGGSAAALANVTNPDGTADNLLLDIHKYLDEDNSGTHEACTTDNVDAFTAVAAFLRQTGRKAIVSETGASQDPTCFTNFCSQNSFINQNADVFVGLVGWAAGSFATSYILSLTPSTQGGKLVDNQLMQQCVLDKWVAAPGSSPPASAPPRVTTVTSRSVVMTTVTSRPVVVTTVRPSRAAGVPQPSPSPSDSAYTMTVSVMTGAPGGGGGDGDGLLTASGTPTVEPAALATPPRPSGGADGLQMATTTPAAAAPTGDAGALETASGSPNGTAAAAQFTAPSGPGVVTASGAGRGARASGWTAPLAIGFRFMLASAVAL